jgi:hypothetical protein
VTRTKTGPAWHSAARDAHVAGLRELTLERAARAREAFLEDLDELVEQGEKREGIARRLGLTRAALERRLYRAGRPLPPLED